MEWWGLWRRCCGPAGRLNRPISKPTLVGRCWPPGARPHSAPVLTLSETLRILRFQRQGGRGETALSPGLGLAYLIRFNPLHHLRPAFTLWQLHRRRRNRGLLPLDNPVSFFCWPGNVHLGRSPDGRQCQFRPEGPRSFTEAEVSEDGWRSWASVFMKSLELFQKPWRS